MSSLDTKLKEIQELEQNWQIEKDIIIREEKIKQEKKDLKKKKLPSTSKLLISFLFINCTLVEIFTGYATLLSISMGVIDFAPLVALIGAVVGEVIGYAIYSAKATKENTVGGLTYEHAMHEMNNNVG